MQHPRSAPCSRHPSPRQPRGRVRRQAQHDMVSPAAALPLGSLLQQLLPSFEARLNAGVYSTP